MAPPARCFQKRNGLIWIVKTGFAAESFSAEVGQAETPIPDGDRLDPPFRQFVGFECLVPEKLVFTHASFLEA